MSYFNFQVYELIWVHHTLIYCTSTPVTPRKGTFNLPRVTISYSKMPKDQLGGGMVLLLLQTPSSLSVPLFSLTVSATYMSL